MRGTVWINYKLKIFSFTILVFKYILLVDTDYGGSDAQDKSI